MKKFILSLGLVAMMLNLTNCAQYEDVNPTVEPQGDFELFASVSRTANDGLNTVWKAGDNLTVFHAEAGATTYVYDAEFKLESAETGRFTGTLESTLTAEAYDWYAIYPHNSYHSSKNPEKSAYIPVCGSKSDIQTQNGNNSMAHIAGENYPLVGVAKGVANGTAPAVAMKNVASLLEFEVTNSLDEAITVTNITLTAPEYIIGTFYVHFADIDNVSVTSSGASYTSKTATLAVENGTAIAKGETGKFYLAVAPFVAAANSSLSLEVNVTSGEKVSVLSKTITLANETAFVSGKIKPIAVNYNVEFVSEGLALPFEDDFAWANHTNEITASNIDEKYTTVTKVYGDSQALKFGTTSVLGNITTVPLNLSQPFTVVFDAKAWTGDTSVVKITVGDQTKATEKLTETYEKYMIQFDAATATSTVKIAFAENATSTDVNKHRGFIDNLQIITGHDYVLPPVLKLNTTSLNVQAEASTTTIGYSVKNAVEGVTVNAVSNNDWITVTPTTNAFDVAVAENTGEERTGTITVTYGDSISETITVTQAAPKGDVVLVEKTASHVFQNNATFNTWNSSYSARTIEFTEATVKFASANKQSQTITDMPVTKGGAVELIAKNGATIKNAKFVCKQWTTKAQTITMHYSTNGGNSYTQLTGTSTTFTIEKTDLPAGTNAVKITFSSTSNQVGIQQADITYLVEE